MNQNPFDKNIKQKADSHEAPVPADAWDNISKKKRKNPYPIFWWSLSSLLIIVAIVTYTNSGTHSTISSKQKIAQKNDNLIVPNNDNISPGKQEDNSTPHSFTTTGEPVKNESFKFLNNDQNAKENENKLFVKTENNDLGNHHEKTSVRKHKKISVTQKGRLTSLIENAENIEEENAERPGHVVNNKDKLTEITNTEIAIQEDITVSPLFKMGYTDSKDSTKNNHTDSSDATKKIDEKKIVKKDEKKSASYKFFIEFSATPILPIQSYNSSISLKRTTISDSNRTEYTANSIKSSIDPAVAFNIYFTKKINNKLSIGTGLQYLLLKEKTTLSGEETNTIYSTVQRLAYNNSGPYLITDTIQTTNKGTRIIDAVNSYKTYSIPLFIRYSLASKSAWGLDMAIGLYFNISTSYNNSITGTLQTIDNNRILPAGNKTSTGADLFCGLHFSRQIHKNWWLFTEPTIKLNFNNYDIKNTFISKKIHNVGVSFGITKGFH